MISICLKSNNINTLNDIEKSLDSTKLPEIYYSQKKFKYLNNIIIHYKGKYRKKFYNILSEIIANAIVLNFENQFIIHQLSFDFFYFSVNEKKNIRKNCSNSLKTPLNIAIKKDYIKCSLLEYFKENTVCNINGFFNFRLDNYKNFLNSVLEDSINDYILQKEYTEYVQLLYQYIQMQIPQNDNIHLIYTNDQKMLLDESKNIISNSLEPNIYISDISFSSNDFILNTLLSKLPNKLYIHTNIPDDNFLTFLKLIFKDKYYICNNCKLCSQYLNTQKKSSE